MGAEFFFGSLFLLLIISSIVLSWVNFFTLQKLKSTLAELEQQKAPTSQPAIQPASATDNPIRDVVITPPMSVASVDPQLLAISQKPAVDPWNSQSNPATPPKKEQKEGSTKYGNWMVWMGGLCVALSGIFLARYSIEEGLLGPTARITLGIITGLGLLVAAEWLRRKTQVAFSAVAALAGGASVMLYSVILASLHLYQLWPPLLVFALLALVSLGSMLLALWHGPVLAVIGITGAYLVPLLLGESDGDPLLVQIYVLIITAAALFLQRYVQRTWLLAITLAGTFGWWWLMQITGSGLESMGLYLTLAGYCLISIPHANFSLKKTFPDQPVKRSLRAFFRIKSLDQQQLVIGLALTLLAQAISILLNPAWESALVTWSPLLLLVLIASTRNENLKLLPWLSALLMILAIVFNHLSTQLFMGIRTTGEHSVALQQLLLVWTLIYVVFATIHRRKTRYPALALSLGTLFPLLALALLWQFTELPIHASFVAATSLILGLAYIGRGHMRQQRDPSKSWLIFAGHLGYSLAMVIFFDTATLTLALATQVVSLAWLHQQHPSGLLSGLMKIILMLIMARLTLLPWIAPQFETSLLIYVGCFALAVIASRMNQSLSVRSWLEGASLHLGVLLCAMALRYFLYDGDMFRRQFNLTEASLNGLLWGSLGLVYYYRGFLSDHLRSLYHHIAELLLIAFVFSYALVLTWFNPLFNANDPVSSTPIANVLLIAYGAPLLLFILAGKFYKTSYRTGFYALAGIGTWIFLNLEIRHLWQGELSFYPRAESGELYTYSLVWLVMAASSLLYGTLRQHQKLYQAGMLLLMVTIGKIFLIDMSGLTGLLRVASFMGLGLCLLGLAFTHQYLARSQNTKRAEMAPE